MSHTMSKTRMAVGSGAALLTMLVLPAGQSVAAPDEDVDITHVPGPARGLPAQP